MFKIGDPVFYPLHGVGYIAAIETKEVLGQNKVYYIVNIPQTRMQIMIPVKNEESFGVRRLSDSTVLEKILDNFQLGNTDPLIYQSQKYCTDLNTKKMKSGDIFKGTEIIRDLTRKNLLGKLGKEDAKMLESARHMFISELMEVKQITKENATNLLDSALVINA
jgi:CarD family transcriptional regulator